MARYVARRFLSLALVLFLVSIIIFALMRLLPGDAALMLVFGGGESSQDPRVVPELRKQLGLDRPYVIQYADWLWRLLSQGDFGTSFLTKGPVFKEILSHLPITLELAVGTIFFALLVGIPAGIVTSTRQDTFADYVARLGSIAGLSIPGFWLGTLLIVFPAIWFGYLPPLGYIPLSSAPLDNFRQFLFPCLALGAADAAIVMRMTRSEMLEVLRQDYIRTARAKGVREQAVLFRHALKNALIPVVTITGLQFGYLLGRTVVIESVFGLPGLGTLTLTAVIQRDYPQIQGNVLFIAAMFVLVNLIVDLSYAWLDPRIRYG